MPITVTFKCGGCFATAEGTDFLRREFRSYSGRRWGIGGTVRSNDIEDITPEGWVAYDPYTYATYCPKCWAWIMADDEDVEEETQ